jgi:hypothetical protein
MSRAAARSARAEMGSIEAVKDHVRDAGGKPCSRIFRVTPLRTADAASAPRICLRDDRTLALGIGANTAVFSVAHAVWLQPLPYPEPQRLAPSSHHRRAARQRPSPSHPTFRDWQSQSRSMEAMAAYVVAGATLTGRGEAEAPVTSAVTPNLFSLLGASPMLGRMLVPGDARSTSGRVVVLSELFWRERFGGQADIVGQTLVLDGAGYTVVGVMPSSFRFPHMTPAPQIWMPLHQFQPFQQLLEVRMAPFLTVIGRLGKSSSRSDAQAEMETIVRRLREEHPAVLREQVVRVAGTAGARPRRHEVVDCAAAGGSWRASVDSVHERASLQLARTIGRTRELAVRSALGAARSRLVRQFLVENLLLALAGGAVGSRRICRASVAERPDWRCASADSPRGSIAGCSAHVLLSCAAASYSGCYRSWGRAAWPRARR